MPKSNYQYDFTLVVGRFQPFHNTHKNLIQHGLEIGEKVLIVLGSAKSAPDVKNPFTPQMREKMIRACFPKATQERLKFVAIRDYPYNENIWIAEVQNAVNNELESTLETNHVEFDEVLHRTALGSLEVCLLGFFKDESSYYLKMFPQWKFEDYYDGSAEARKLNATDIRNLYFENKEYDKLVPAPVARLMEEFADTQEFTDLCKEYQYIKKYKHDTQFLNVPYAPIFVTTDCLVTAMGHILVVKRGANPGRGLLALAGGFLQPELTLFDNAIKELREETQIKVHAEQLRSKVVNEKIFDYPNRSLRGRTITYAYHIELNPNLQDGLPLIKGGDDAAQARWIPIASLADYEDKFFEDHFHIIKYFLGM
jgi:bifunctional NMN adenylyltransferase/nudix hydrolase